MTDDPNTPLWQRVLVRPEHTILEALRVIDAGTLQIALVVDEARRLVGTLTDGDVRRGMLRGVDLQQPVARVMNASPVRLEPGIEPVVALALMQRRHLRHIPIVDADGVLIGLETLDRYAAAARRDNLVVLMAGGAGTRLRPLTEDRPKPMLEVGGRPILETILLNFLEFGFNRFAISLNYKGEMIREHFGDGSRWGAEIAYVVERERLGTAGALGLLDPRPTRPILVMNGDVLTKANFAQLLEFHEAHACAATMCVREQEFQVPYGVLTLEGQEIVEIREKPVTRHFVNSGIYVLEPRVLELLPRTGYCDMPELFDSLIRSGGKAAAFPLREYWLDIGQRDDYSRAHTDYAREFP